MDKQFYEILKDLREDNDKKQWEIAQVLGASQQVYARYEKGDRAMPIQHLITLCKFYNVSADYVLGLIRNKKKIGE